MKKKEYLKPSMKILITHSDQQLLAASDRMKMPFDPHSGTDDAF